MKKFKFIFSVSVLLQMSQIVWSQEQEKKEEPNPVKKTEQRLANKQMREGNAQYENGNYADAEVSYKKSIATVAGNSQVDFNLGNAMMQQKRYKEAYNHFDYLAKSTKDQDLKAKSFHNMGNAQMGIKDYQKAIESYKNSLRINPNDEETRYNLALAQKFLKENPPKKNKDNKDKKDNKDNKDNKQDQKDQQNKDNKDKKEDQKKDSKDQKDNSKNNPKEDNKDPKDNQDDQKNQNQPKPGSMSEQQIKQLLEALNNEEKKTQEKVKAQNVKAKTPPKVKDW